MRYQNKRAINYVDTRYSSCHFSHLTSSVVVHFSTFSKHVHESIPAKDMMKIFISLCRKRGYPFLMSFLMSLIEQSMKYFSFIVGISSSASSLVTAISG